MLVAPAGDDGQGPGIVNYPAAYPGVIAVGAIGRTGHLASFSSRRSYASLTAPGVGLVAAAPPDGYGTISSTSAASGIVAGVAALVLSRFPHLTVAQVTQALIESTAAARPAAPACRRCRPGRRPEPATAPWTRSGRWIWPPSSPRRASRHQARSGRRRRTSPRGIRRRRLTGRPPARWPDLCCGTRWPRCACSSSCSSSRCWWCASGGIAARAGRADRARPRGQHENRRPSRPGAGVHGRARDRAGGRRPPGRARPPRPDGLRPRAGKAAASARSGPPRTRLPVR